MATDAATTTTEAATFNFRALLPYIAFIPMFYYFMVYQPKKKQKEHQNMLSGLRKGDKVCTSGGIIGQIHKVDATSQEATIEIADGVRICVLKNALAVYSTGTGTATTTTTKTENKDTTQTSLAS